MQRNPSENHRNGTNSDARRTDETTSPTNRSALKKLNSYFIALRYWSLSASFIPTVLGKEGKVLCNKFFSLPEIGA